MKQLLFYSFIFFHLVLFLGNTTCKAQNVDIPDVNFKAVLVGNTIININNDGEIQMSEAAAFNGEIYAGNINISDMTGIESFVISHNCIVIEIKLPIWISISILHLNF